MTVSFLWFDIGYTLLYMQRETTYQQTLRRFDLDVPLKDIEKEFHLSDKLFMREYPGIFLKPREIYMPTYLGIMNYRLGLNLNICELNEHWEAIKGKLDNYWLPFEGVTSVLSRLKNDRFGLGVISNWDCTAREVLSRAGLINYFDHLIISCEVGYIKPDARIFHLALAKAGVKGPECLYVGDNYYDDALGSRKVGMRSLILNRFGSLGVEEITDCPIITDISEIFDYLTPAGKKRKDATTGS